MAYFDSPKNRAIWERELESLRPERARREATGFQPLEQQVQAAAKEQSRYRKQINLEQLETAMKEKYGTSLKKPTQAAKAAAKAPVVAQQKELEGAVRVPRPKRPVGSG